MGVLSPIEVSRVISSYANILIIDDDKVMGEALLTLLESVGYRVDIAVDGGEGLYKLTNGKHYDLVLLDVMLPGLDGWTVLSRMRAAPATARIPIIMLTAMTEERNEVDLLAAGADDYISKPFSFDKLIAHINALLRRSALQSINPLTGLPGNRQVERFLQRCVQEDEHFWAAAYIDIDNFKAYNDCYGFLQGDEVLKATADFITAAACRSEHDIFVGNIGGDDFLAGFFKEAPRADLKASREVEEVLETMADQFDRGIRHFYTQEDFARGYLSAESRRGGIERFPLMSLSIAVVTNTHRLFNHPLEISNTFASVKHRAKSQPGSAVCFDQRRR
ncbi:MAG TPA: response regulator [Blastocatellia bacterium]|nr:response regulator [Blastocatellia bacterium]